MKNKNLTYEELRGRGGYGFTNWVDNGIDDSITKKRLVLPIHEKLETSSSPMKGMARLAEEAIKEYGEVVKSFYYKPTDKAAYLIRTLDHYHEVVFSDFEKYFFGENEGEGGKCILQPHFLRGKCILQPHIFLDHPEVRDTKEVCLDELIFEHLESGQTFFFRINPHERYLEAHLFGRKDDEEAISKIISVIPYYEKMIRNPYNLALSKKVIGLKRKQKQQEKRFNEKLKRLCKKENALKNHLRKA